jgi:hypothetical protein
MANLGRPGNQNDTDQAMAGFIPAYLANKRKPVMANDKRQPDELGGLYLCVLCQGPIHLIERHVAAMATVARDP